jgi:uncharacterized protein YggE
MQPQSQVFTRYVPLVAIMLSLFLLVQVINGLKMSRTIGDTAMPSNVISVSGDGEAFAIPDVAMFTFSASATGKDVDDAQKQVTKIIEAALGKVKELGVDSKDVKTTDYSANPKYEYINGVCTSGGVCKPSTQNLIGYEVSQTIAVKVRKVDDAGKILGAIGGTGVTNVSGLSFTVDDQTAIEREAREKAIAKAKVKAEELAKDLGVSLVRIVSFNENGAMPMFYKADMISARDMGGAMTEAASVPLPMGQNKVTSNVTITYEIR